MCDVVGHDQGILNPCSCLSKFCWLSLYVLCCSFVCIDVLLRRRSFFPKRLELLLKVVVFSTTRSLACVCTLLSREAGPEVPRAVDSQRKVLLLFQKIAVVHRHSALICTQNKLWISRVKPWH